jgi:hypothetical protein
LTVVATEWWLRGPGSSGWPPLVAVVIADRIPTSPPYGCSPGHYRVSRSARTGESRPGAQPHAERGSTAEATRRVRPSRARPRPPRVCAHRSPPPSGGRAPRRQTQRSRAKAEPASQKGEQRRVRLPLDRGRRDPDPQRPAAKPCHSATGHPGHDPHHQRRAPPDALAPLDRSGCLDSPACTPHHLLQDFGQQPFPSIISGSRETRAEAPVRRDGHRGSRHQRFDRAGEGQ